jgi:hypothetical protein
MEKEKENKSGRSNKTMDNPEQYQSENKSLFDQFESEKNVDPIPMEDLKLEQREEKDGHHTKDSSSSEKKYKTGM